MLSVWPDASDVARVCRRSNNPRVRNTVSPIKLETGLRPNSAGIPYTLLLRFEAIGFPTFGLLLYAFGYLMSGWGFLDRVETDLVECRPQASVVLLSQTPKDGVSRAFASRFRVWGYVFFRSVAQHWEWDSQAMKRTSSRLIQMLIVRHSSN